MIDILNSFLAKDQDAKAVCDFVNSAYRGESSKAGWTTEAHLLDGIRTSKEEIEQLILSKEDELWIFKQANILQGCVSLRLYKDYIYLGMLTVKPTSQNAGIGKFILSFVEQRAQILGVSVIEMTVISERIELINWYERRGYEITGEKRPFPMGDAKFGIAKKNLEFIVMKKHLIP